MTIPELRAAVEGLDPQDFAAESWTVMRWLLANQRLGEAGKYFGLVMTQGQSVDEAIQNAFGMSTAELDTELQRFAHQPPKSTVMPLPSNALPNSVVVKKVMPPSARAMLAETAMSLLDDPAPAVAELDAMMKQDQNNAGLHRALAVAYMRQNRMDLMIENARRAIALEDSDPRMHYFYAVFLNEGNRDSVHVQSAVARLSGELNVALRMNSNYAEAHNLYGLAMLAGDKHAQALGELGLARSTAPRNERYMMNMAIAFAANGDQQDARNMLALLSRSSQPEIAREAHNTLSNITEQKKKEQAMAARYSGAQETVDPRWQAHDGLGVLPDPDEKLTRNDAPPDTRKVENLKGKIVSIECSAEGNAVLHVAASGHQWTFKAPNYANTVLIGPARFDCGWRDVNASINYKASGTQEGDIVTLEID
jgi:Flp pilus assembly protein TadD